MTARPLYASVAYRPSFPSGNRRGIPELLPVQVPRRLLRLPLYPYRTRERDGICHFFLHDDKFEGVWNRPLLALDVVRSYRAALTPDFSLYRDMPLAAQVWNVYRSRWLGRFWQEQGVAVIPTVRWSTPESYRFCFEGITRGQVVATGTPDLRDPVTRKLFERGLAEMFERLRPTCLILFGRPPKDFPLKQLISRKCRLVVHASHWQALRARDRPSRR